MRVVFTTAARSDLAEIADHIHSDHPRRAQIFTDEIVSACEALADLPYGAPIVPRYATLGYRRKVHKNYLIFYRVGPDDVEIIRVLHGARDFVRLLTRIPR